MIGLLIYYFYPEDKLPNDIIIDNIVVNKSKRELLAYSNGQLQKTYKISLGRQPIGAKEIEGDKKLQKVFILSTTKTQIVDITKTWVFLIPTKMTLKMQFGLENPQEATLKYTELETE